MLGEVDPWRSDCYMWTKQVKLWYEEDGRSSWSQDVSRPWVQRNHGSSKPGFCLWDCWRCWFWTLTNRKINQPCNVDDQTPAMICLLSRQQSALFAWFAAWKWSPIWSRGLEQEQMCCCTVCAYISWLWASAAMLLFLADLKCPAIHALCML